MIISTEWIAGGRHGLAVPQIGHNGATVPDIIVGNIIHIYMNMTVRYAYALSE